MTGTIINVGAILAGGTLGLLAQRQISPGTQNVMKVLMGAFTAFVGLKMTVTSFHGEWLNMAKQLGVILIAMSLGKLTGRLLHLQQGSNWLGQYARKLMTERSPQSSQRFSEGFMTCTVLFCVGPMAILGSIQDGIRGDFSTLAVKAVMDGMSSMAFAAMFGWGVLFSALPVFAYQGLITMLAHGFSEHTNPAVIESMNGTGGMLIFCISLVILEVKKIELTNYLPSLAWAPFLTWWWLK